MTVALYTIVVLALAGFVAATAVRAWGYARHPIHLRWELYPVPHDDGPWAAPTFMVREILCLHALWHSNRALWYRSYPFHLGLYLMTLAAGLLGLHALMPAAVLPGRAAHWAGMAGTTLAMAGAAALLWRRLTEPALRAATVPGDLFNLGCFLVALGLLALGEAMRDPGAADVAAIAAGLVRWDTSLRIPGPIWAGVTACAALLAYIPLTHMSHFVGKYFTYHAVRWDDRPMAGSRPIAAAMAEYLTYRPTWAAEHVRADGHATWSEIAATKVREGKR